MMKSVNKGKGKGALLLVLLSVLLLLLWIRNSEDPATVDTAADGSHNSEEETVNLEPEEDNEPGQNETGNNETAEETNQTSEATNDSDRGGSENAGLAEREETNSVNEAAVEINANELPVEEEATEEQNNSAEQPNGGGDSLSDSNLYTNSQFGFSIELPETWKNIIRIDTNTFSPDQEGAVNIYFAPSGEINQLVFSLLVYTEETGKEQEDNPFWTQIATENGYTFGYIIPGEPTEELLAPENSEKLELVQHMIYSDLPEIINSFQFH